MRKIFFGSILVLTLVLLTTEAFACSCGTKPTVLDSFEDSTNVFSARLTSVDKTREKADKYDIDYIRSSSMIVLKVYKGYLKPGQEVKFAQGGGADCVWTFDEKWIGAEFLFYVGKPSDGHPMFSDEGGEKLGPMYYAITCGRSRGLKGAIDDLSYLDNMSKLQGRTRVSGSFESWYTDESIGANKKIKIVGKTKTVTVKADENGFFEIYDLPAGEYRIFPEIPAGWKINDYMMKHTDTGLDMYQREVQKGTTGIPIKIADKRHVSLDLYFDIDTAISGRVLSPSGRPMEDVCVKAVSTELKDDDFRGRSDCTDASGKFKIEEMAKGNYYLVVNDDGKQNSINPFGVIFYPGVTDRKNAGVVYVEPGKYVASRDIQIPAFGELVELRGKLTYSDGSPVEKESVRLRPTEQSSFEDSRVETDAKGNFSLLVPKGSAGKLYADDYVYLGLYENCEKLDELIKASGKTGLRISTNIFEFDGEIGSTVIELVFPFPKCVKAKD